MDYGKAIKVIRTARKLTQQDLGLLIGVDASYISKIEAGERIPAIEILEKTSEKLDVPMVLIMLLASEKKNLKGINEDQAQFLGKELINVLVGTK